MKREVQVQHKLGYRGDNNHPEGGEQIGLPAWTKVHCPGNLLSLTYRLHLFPGSCQALKSAVSDFSMFLSRGASDDSSIV